jgi:Predicted integral membrane protein (DUF2269)
VRKAPRGAAAPGAAICFAPMSGTITWFGIGLFLHVLAVVVAIGPTFAYGIFIGVAESNSPRSVPAVLRAIQKHDRMVLTPGLGVVLLAGIYMLIDGHISAGDSWVTIGFIAIIALFGMVHGYFRPNTDRALELAERDLATGDALSAEYAEISKKLENGGKVAGAIVAITIFFMVVQP